MTDVLPIPELKAALSNAPDNALRGARADAVDSLASQGLPTTRHEDWKYTDLSDAYSIHRQWLSSTNRWESTPNASKPTLESVMDIDADWLVIRNGQPDRASVSAMDIAGIRIEFLSETGTSTDVDSPLALLNLAQLSEGLRISVDEQCQLDRPLGLLFIDDDEEKLVTNSRVEIYLENGGSLDVVEVHVPTKENFANVVVAVNVARQASVNYVRVQDRAASQSLTTNLLVSPSTDSEFNFTGIDLGGGFTRHDIVADISATNARVNVSGLYVTDGKQHVDNHTRVDHRVGPAESSSAVQGDSERAIARHLERQSRGSCGRRRHQRGARQSQHLVVAAGRGGPEAGTRNLRRRRTLRARYNRRRAR